MKPSVFVRATLVLTLFIVCLQLAPAQDTLPRYITIELKRVEETWHILDLIAAKIWPGWNNYADVPFLFEYPNGVQLLVGHPSPPPGFSPVAGLELRGKKIFLDRRKEVALAMPLPLFGGGGPVPFGYAGGKMVTVIHITSRPYLAPSGEKKEVTTDYARCSENQILLNIHELFHCFQSKMYNWRHGNLFFNNDENYATYAEIEGLALERAYLESNDARAKEFLKDCLVAKQIKQNSMNETERMQESEEDVMEGTATYSELMTSTSLRHGYHPAMTQKDDPFFFSFRYADSLIQLKLNMLRNARSASLSSVDKCYPFGCYQAMLLTRFSPGWRDGFFQRGRGLDEAIDSLLGMTPKEREAVASRLKSRYGYDTIYARHARVIGERNYAYYKMRERKGLAFIVSFKNTGEHFMPESPSPGSKVGLLYLYLRGIRKIKIADVLFEGEETPMVNDQIYYVKWVDTEAKGIEGSYKVEGVREGTTNVYRNAVFTTRGFKLSAPKIEIKETKNRVKITVLAKVRE